MKQTSDHLLFIKTGCRKGKQVNEFLKENHQRTETDCGQWDLNPYALRHRNLNPARLPIPP